MPAEEGQNVKTLKQILKLAGKLQEKCGIRGLRV